MAPPRFTPSRRVEPDDDEIGKTLLPGGTLSDVSIMPWDLKKSFQNIDGRAQAFIHAICVIILLVTNAVICATANLGTTTNLATITSNMTFNGNISGGNQVLYKTQYQVSFTANWLLMGALIAANIIFFLSWCYYLLRGRVIFDGVEDNRGYSDDKKDSVSLIIADVPYTCAASFTLAILFGMNNNMLGEKDLGANIALPGLVVCFVCVCFLINYLTSMIISIRINLEATGEGPSNMLANIPWRGVPLVVVLVFLMVFLFCMITYLHWEPFNLINQNNSLGVTYYQTTMTWILYAIILLRVIFMLVTDLYELFAVMYGASTLRAPGWVRKRVGEERWMDMGRWVRIYIAFSPPVIFATFVSVWAFMFNIEYSTTVPGRVM